MRSALAALDGQEIRCSARLALITTRARGPRGIVIDRIALLRDIRLVSDDPAENRRELTDHLWVKTDEFFPALPSLRSGLQYTLLLRARVLPYGKHNEHGALVTDYSLFRIDLIAAIPLPGNSDLIEVVI